MLKLEEIKKNAAVAGIEPGLIVRVVTTEPAGPDALTVYYKTAEGKVQERMLRGGITRNLPLMTATPHYTLAKKEHRPAFKVGGQCPFKRVDLDRWTEQQKTVRHASKD
jgi:hypothetical protein